MKGRGMKKDFWIDLAGVVICALAIYAWFFVELDLFPLNRSIASIAGRT